MRSSIYKVLLVCSYGVATALFIKLLLAGSDYYTTPLIQRPRHIDYWKLKPGGSIGLVYGISGASLMTAMLVYSVRKRIRPLRRLGGVRYWLDFHIFCGIFGPALIVLHSSFKIHGLVALSFWSMVIVATSGLLGRYLYIQFPRARTGDELSLLDVERTASRLATRLHEEFGVPTAVIDRIDRLALSRARPDAGLLSTLFLLPLGDPLLRLDLRHLRRSMPPVDKRAMQSLTRSMQQRASLKRRIHLWNRLHRLFHYWHVLHKPFAVIMYLFMAVHIAVALTTGYGWTN